MSIACQMEEEVRKQTEHTMNLRFFYSLEAQHLASACLMHGPFVKFGLVPRAYFYHEKHHQQDHHQTLKHSHALFFQAQGWLTASSMGELSPCNL